MVTARCVHGWTRWQGCRECVPHDPNDVRDRMEGRMSGLAQARLEGATALDTDLGELSDFCGIDRHYGTKGV